jgi:hypothetical protein
MAKALLAHAPKSMSLQRWLQKGRCGKAGLHSKPALQVGHVSLGALVITELQHAHSQFERNVTLNLRCFDLGGLGQQTYPNAVLVGAYFRDRLGISGQP